MADSGRNSDLKQEADTQNGTSRESTTHSPPTTEPTTVEQDPSLVVWEPGDSHNPHNWTLKRKWFVTIVLNTLPLFVNVGSSILTGSSSAIGKEYGVSTEVTILVITMFLLV
jgi:MFS transporter, DHA1 family, multidrug resistance protein